MIQLIEFVANIIKNIVVAKVADTGNTDFIARFAKVVADLQAVWNDFKALPK